MFLALSFASLAFGPEKFSSTVSEKSRSHLSKWCCRICIFMCFSKGLLLYPWPPKEDHAPELNDDRCVLYPVHLVKMRRQQIIGSYLFIKPTDQVFDILPRIDITLDHAAITTFFSMSAPKTQALEKMKICRCRSMQFRSAFFVGIPARLPGHPCKLFCFFFRKPSFRINFPIFLSGGDFFAIWILLRTGCIRLSLHLRLLSRRCHFPAFFTCSSKSAPGR